MANIRNSSRADGRREYFKLLAVCLLACGPANVARAQSSDVASGVGAGFTPLLPTVPATAPGAAEGPAADQKFDPRAAQQPVASFIDSIRGNDAAVEVVVGQGRLLTIKNERGIAGPRGSAVIAVGDPTVLEFQVLPNPRMIRLIGLRAGVTDLSITAPDGQTYSFEVHVKYDLALLKAQLRQMFPDAELHLGQMREHMVVEGQARSTSQVTRIIETLQAYLDSIRSSRNVEQNQAAGVAQPPAPSDVEPAPEGEPLPPLLQTAAELSAIRNSGNAVYTPQIINLLRVPGVQQVLLKVQIAELNRTALRQVGADLLAVDNTTGTIAGSITGSGILGAGGLLGLGGMDSTLNGVTGPTATAFGIIPTADFGILFHCLRRNNVVNILAEPNLIAMSGHHANFLAGGEFPVPVPQGAGGLSNNVTIQFKQFGVRLDFQPFVMDDNVIRLSVTPEVSSIDFTLGTTLVQGGRPVPGLNTRRTETTVELSQGQTLAISGLLRVDLEAQTNRIPGLGDLPYIGPFFSNTSHQRVEKELLVLVTPHLVKPMEPHQVPPLPGSEIKDPTDLEFYFLNRIEGRVRRPYRATTDYDCITNKQQIHYNRSYIQGPSGLSTDCPTQGPMRTSH